MLRIPLQPALLVALSLCLAASAPARADVVAVNEPWVRPAPAGGDSEAFMQVASSEGATVVDIRCDAAGRVRLVTSRGRQRAPFDLALPPRTEVFLSPGKTRIALARVVRPLKLGDRVPVTLVLRYADGTTKDIDVDAEVRRRSPSDDHHVPHKH